ncbi:MAG: ABC transporter permease [Propioniciclava sp.]
MSTEALVTPRSTRRRLSVDRTKILGVVAFELILIVVFSITTGRFLAWENVNSILFTAAIFTVAAVGEALVILTGNYDLSVGSIMGVSAYVTFDLAGANPALGPWVVFIAVALGLAMGAINGVLVAVFSLNSMVATLGTLSIYRGFVSLYASAQEVTSGELPGWIRALYSSQPLGISMYVWTAAIVVILAAFALAKLPMGRQLYAYGSNQAAAQYYGLKPVRVLMTAYLGSGVLAALAGLLLGVQVGNINSLLGWTYEMQILAAVVIGGVSIFGGSGSVIGVAIGAIVLASINNGLVLMGTRDSVRLLIQGIALVLAVGVDAFIQRRLAPRRGVEA